MGISDTRPHDTEPHTATRPQDQSHKMLHTATATPCYTESHAQSPRAPHRATQGDTATQLFVAVHGRLWLCMATRCGCVRLYVAVYGSTSAISSHTEHRAAYPQAHTVLHTVIPRHIPPQNSLTEPYTATQPHTSTQRAGGTEEGPIPAEVGSSSLLQGRRGPGGHRVLRGH